MNKVGSQQMPLQQNVNKTMECKKFKLFFLVTIREDTIFSARDYLSFFKFILDGSKWY
jgi:hypothetical protein